MNYTKIKRLTIICLAIYWPLLFILTHIPIEKISRIIFSLNPYDKCLHIAAFLILTFLLWISFFDEKSRLEKSSPWIILASLSLYAFIDEFLQSFVGRNVEILDAAADIIGVIIALLICTFFKFSTSILAAALTTVIILILPYCLN